MTATALRVLRWLHGDVDAPSAAPTPRTVDVLQAEIDALQLAIDAEAAAATAAQSKRDETSAAIGSLLMRQRLGDDVSAAIGPLRDEHASAARAIDEHRAAAQVAGTRLRGLHGALTVAQAADLERAHEQHVIPRQAAAAVADAAKDAFAAALRSWCEGELQDSKFRQQRGLVAGRDILPRVVDILSATIFDALPPAMAKPTSFDLSVTAARCGATFASSTPAPPKVTA